MIAKPTWCKVKLKGLKDYLNLSQVIQLLMRVNDNCIINKDNNPSQRYCETIGLTSKIKYIKNAIIPNKNISKTQSSTRSKSAENKTKKKKRKAVILQKPYEQLSLDYNNS